MYYLANTVIHQVLFVNTFFKKIIDAIKHKVSDSIGAHHIPPPPKIQVNPNRHKAITKNPLINEMEIA